MVSLRIERNGRLLDIIKLKLLHVFENNLVICQNLVGKISNLKIVKKKSEI